MINITRLYCGTLTPGDVLRYGRKSSDTPSELLRFTEDKKPVVVWSVSRRCNLRCVHCYSDSENKEYPGELSAEEGKRLIEDLADFGVPVLLFSGGEPLMHPFLLEFARLAASKDIRVVVSTNGVLLMPEIARELRDAGASYAGVSIDGL
jgi:MoaA/NifB/PqqE/SkfB family radical SAM enzyme